MANSDLKMLLSLLMLVVVVGGALAAPQELEDSVIDDVFDEFDFLDVVEEGNFSQIFCYTFKKNSINKRERIFYWHLQK